MGASESQFGCLIDGTIDELRKHVEDKDRGYVHSLIVLLEDTYTRLTKLKDEYIDRSIAATGKEAVQEMFDTATKKVYVELLKIEEKITFLVGYEKQLSIEGNSDLTND